MLLHAVLRSTYDLRHRSVVSAMTSLGRLRSGDLLPWSLRSCKSLTYPEWCYKFRTGRSLRPFVRPSVRRTTTEGCSFVLLGWVHARLSGGTDADLTQLLLRLIAIHSIIRRDTIAAAVNHSSQGDDSCTDWSGLATTHGRPLKTRPACDIMHAGTYAIGSYA